MKKISFALVSVVALGGYLVSCSHAEKPTITSSVLKFNHSPGDITAACDRQQAELESRIDAIGKMDRTTANFSNSVGEIERVTAEFSNAINPVLFLKYVSTDKEVRESADKCEQAVDKLFVDLFVREDLYQVVKAASENDRNMEPKARKLTEEYLTDFIRNGLDLPAAKRKEFVIKKKELVGLQSQFSKNLVEWKDHLEVTRAELDGMDEGYIKGLKKTDSGKYKVTLAYPDFYPFMQNAKSGEARRKLQLKFYNRGGKKNKELLEKAIRLRAELASMLGKKNHADFVLEKRMAQEPETVLAFLDDLVSKLRKKGRSDLADLLELKKQDDPSATSIDSHEWRYYAEQFKKKKHNVDSQLIKEYFPLDVVLKGMFEIYEGLLGVEFVEDPSRDKWHDSVTAYQVRDNGETVAVFFMDLFPREGKYGHAAAFTLLSGYQRADNTYEMPASSIVANFNAPAEGQPSLLTHSQVETLFHEFGHIMHQVLTEAKYATFSGTRVKRDFVEAPSQMLENWVWEKESLQKLSGHYQDKSKPLPDELIKKMVDAKLANVGIKYLRQAMFATLDMTYHTNKNVDTTAVYKKLSREVMLIPIPDGTMPQASFGHLMGGYDAGYYGYLWSEVYAQDMFTRFAKEGLLNSKTGADYRNWILAKGGEQNPMELITGFLGRKPNNEAFLKSVGL